MCGIMGYNGEKNATDIVICGLTKLEYRGYDSAGLSVFGKTGITTVKTTGRVFSLREKCDKIEGFCGIGHTRWATHGKVSVKNAHPHTTKNIALVHNGIIENYKELKDFLIDKGYTFNTDTDTEIALMLIDYYYENGNSPIEAITHAIKRLRGSYAFAIIFAHDKNTIYAVKKDSPLLIGIGQGEMFLASDLSAFNEYTDKYIRLADYEIAKIGKINLELFNLESKPLPIKINKRDGEADLSDMEGFSHFMEKEIFQQPDILSRELLYYTEDLMPKFDFPDLEPISYIRLIACGTAYHAALIGAQFIEKTAKIPSRAETAGEFI